MTITITPQAPPKYVTEPINMSTLQMIYKVKRATNDNQKTMKETNTR